MARGDHIKTYRMNGLYSHHGIDMGDGTVIHFSGEPFRASADACVCRVSLEAFRCGSPVKVVRDGITAADPDQICAAAEAALGRKGYDILINNCEHFAWQCRTGSRRSRQVERIVAGVAAATTGSAFVAAAVLGVFAHHHLRRARSRT